MGDIYHAGEVYAGSVPIDDTQASEDTVYSSAKVETMMGRVLDGLVFERKDISITSVAANRYSDIASDNLPTKSGYTLLGVYPLAANHRDMWITYFDTTSTKVQAAVYSTTAYSSNISVKYMAIFKKNA